MAIFRFLAPIARAVAMVVILTLAICGATARAQTISNTASLTRTVNGGDSVVLSNTVSFTVLGKLPTRFDFRQWNPSSSSSFRNSTKVKLPPFIV